MKRVWIYGVGVILLAVYLLPVCAEEAQKVKLPENIKVVLEHTKELQWARGKRLPLYVWPIMQQLGGLDDGQAEKVVRELDGRGIGMVASWNFGNKEKTLAESVRIGRIQQKLGLRVNVNANACMYSFFNGDERTFHIDDKGNTFYDDSFSAGRKMGCPFAVKFRYPVVKGQVEYFLRGYKEAGIGIDFIFADWEIDGPIEWNGAWEHSRRCQRCRENIKNIEDFREFQKQLRLIRSDMQRVVFADNVKHYFPRALVGNYGVYPHDGYRYWYDYFEKFVVGAPFKADQRAKYRAWFHEFDLTGYTFAMPTVYTWYQTFDWYDFEDLDYRWFYNMLLVATNAAEHTPSEIPVISFVHWTTTAPPPKVDPKVKQFSRENYKELLWHMLLRGVDGLFLWCPQNELAAEIEPLHEVYTAALEYKEFLDKGEPVSFEVPTKPGAVVSGLKLGDKVLLRRTDFGGEKDPVAVGVGKQGIVVPSRPGRCQIIQIK